MEEEVKIYETGEGMKVVYGKLRDGKVTYLGVAIKAGTRDEREDEWGLAHYVEHTIFKGTEHYSAKEINDAVERLGGDLNAYTTKEMTFVHATVLNEGAREAWQVVREMVTCPTFPEEELRKEANVIVDEIESANDSPDEKLYDDMEGLLFEGTSLGRDILGSVKSVRGFTSEHAKGWVRRMFQPERMTVFVLSSMGLEDVLGMGNELREKENTADEQNLVIGREEMAYAGVKKMVKKMDTHQAYLSLGARGVGRKDKDFHAMALTCNLLGGPAISSWLYTALREERGLAYSAEASYTAYEDTGSVVLAVATEPKNVAKCRRVMKEQLERLKDMDEATLKAAKKQMLGQLAVASEQREGVALSMGKSVAMLGRVVPYEETEQKVHDVTVEDVVRVAKQYLDGKKMFELLYK